MLTRKPLLIIEDSDDDFTFLEICLRNAGIQNQLIRCATGTQVDQFLECVKNATPHERPQFVFLDLNLPGARGAEVLKRLKEHADMAPVPVVVLTTSSQPRDIETSYKLGASGFLTKPLDLDKFEQMVRQVTNYWFGCVRLPDEAGALGVM